MSNLNTLMEVVNQVSSLNTDKALVTFQVDIRSTCNVLPFDFYVQITGDHGGWRIKLAHMLVQHALKGIYLSYVQLRLFAITTSSHCPLLKSK